MSGIIQGLMSSFKSEIKIGDAYEGGYYAGEISTSGNGVATHRLVVAPKSSGQSSSKAWKTSNTSTYPFHNPRTSFSTISKPSKLSNAT
jgi:hypothetical protein